MPLYEYECKKCHHRFERIQKFSDAPMKKCPDCGGPVEQLISAPTVQFKGSGWYVNDYAKKPAGSSGTSGSGSGGSKDGGGKSDDSKSDASKSDTAKGPESKGESGSESRSESSSKSESSSQKQEKPGSDRSRRKAEKR